MFWAVDTNLDSHGPGVGDIKQTVRRWGPAPSHVRPGQCPCLVRPNQSPLQPALSTVLPKETRMPKIVSVLPSLPRHGPALMVHVLVWAQSSTWSLPAPYHTYVHNHKIQPSVSDTFYRLNQWRESENKVVDSKMKFTMWLWQWVNPFIILRLFRVKLSKRCYYSRKHMIISIFHAFRRIMHTFRFNLW